MRVHNTDKNIYKKYGNIPWWCRKREEKENFYMKNILTVRNRLKNIPGAYEVQKPFGKT
jgi:hypothetical protein